MSGAERDLTGVTLWDEILVRHVFAAGTTMPAGGVMVVYGGGNPRCDMPDGVQVVTASTGNLALSNFDSVILKDAANSELLRMSYERLDHGEQSLTLEPDLDDTDPRPERSAGYLPHSVADERDNSAFSPGTRLDGTPF